MVFNVIPKHIVFEIGPSYKIFSRKQELEIIKDGQFNVTCLEFKCISEKSRDGHLNVLYTIQIKFLMLG